MRPYRPGGRACARRSRSYVTTLFTAVALSASLTSASAADLSGVVVDQHGRPLPRARVMVLDGRGTSQDVYADETGHFTVRTDGTCRVQASLTGFRTTEVPCASSLRIVLPLAPVEETVIVTATRSAAPSSQLGVAVTAFGADEIEQRQTPAVSELLRSVPGAMVLQSGARGGVTGLFVRGGESNYNTVLVDGIPLNEPGGTFNFNTLTTENVERVEVVRGANSALFGSDAMSSVVQIFTRRGLAEGGPPRVSAQVDGGSYGTVHASASAAGTGGRFDYSLGAARLSTSNNVPNNDFDNTTLSAHVGTSVGANATIRGLVRAELGRVGTPGQTLYGRPDLDAFYEHNDVVGGATFDQRVSRVFHQRAIYSHTSSRQASTNLNEDAPYTPTYGGRVAPFEFSDFTFDSRTRLHRHYASYQADWLVAGGGRAGRHHITALADWNGERAELEDRMSGELVRASRDNVGAAIQHQLLWRRLSTTAGVRVERNENFGTAVVPRGSAVMTLRQGNATVGATSVRGAAGLGIKEPTVLQNFSLSPYFLGNPDLQPERARSLEVGVDQRLADDRIKLEATWFDSRYRNIIGLRSTGSFTSTYFNIGVTQARGAELGAEFAPIDSVRLRAGYTFVDSAIVESTSAFSPVFAVGQWAFRRPRHSGFVQGSWTLQQVTLDVSGSLLGRFVDSDFSSLEPPILENAGRATLDARLSYRLAPHVTGLLAIDNVTARNYQEPLGYQALGRAVRAGIRVGR